MRRSAPAVARSSGVSLVGREDYDGAASGVGQDAAGGDELTVVGGQFAARLVRDDEDEEGGVFDDPDGGTGGDAFTDLGLGECGTAPVEAAAGSDLDAGSGAFGAGVAAASAGGGWGGSAARDAAAGLG